MSFTKHLSYGKSIHGRYTSTRSIFTFKVPPSLLLKKHGPFSEASSIRSSFLKVKKMGNWLSPRSWILWGRGCSSWDTKCLSTSQVWLSSLKFLCTSLHSTTFFVMKTWWRWSYNLSTSFSFSASSAGVAFSSDMSSWKSFSSSKIYRKNEKKKIYLLLHKIQSHVIT